MSLSTKLTEKLKELEEKAKEIYNLAINLIKQAPIKYSPASSEDFLVVGVSDYSWDNLSPTLRHEQSEIIGKYRGWYNSVKKIIERYLPEDLNKFISYYEKDRHNEYGIIDILQFNVEVWEANKSDVIKKFDDIYSNQKNILSSIKYIEIEEDFQNFDITDDLSRKIEKRDTLNSSFEHLEDTLVQVIYNYILFNPTLFKKSTRGISPQRKQAVKKRDDFRCQICSESFEEEELVVDHIFPYCFGGSHEQINLMALCKNCNEDKSKSLEYYRSDEGRFKIMNNIRRFVRTLPIMHDFGSWLKKMGDARRRIRQPKNDLIEDKGDEFFESEFEEEYITKSPNLKLINEYIKILKNPKIQEDSFSRRLNTICLEINGFRSINEFSQEAIDTVKNYMDFALEFLKKNIANNLKRDLLYAMEVFLYIPKLKEIMKEMYFKDLYSLYEKNFYERPLITILVNLGYFNDKLKNELLKALQEKNIELIDNFSAVSLSSVKEKLVPILTEIHSVSERIDKDSDKDIKKSIERLIRNLENYT